MKLALPTALALACLAAPAFAQTTPAPAPAPTTAAATAKFTLDTPIATIAADAKGKTVLDTDLPGTTTHPMYESFKGMSLRQVQAFAPDKLTDERLKKVETDLAAIK
ncbi:hypothetical protein AB2M62_15905 [Sphingomonas sp. MMS12-HWE2-04]|uniref:hypothetical protein n=1 Tax=Sphingomonas sp. MMS12-HWE2-04 TaxID=3234199 RepID=UPI00384A5B12